jgi:hypothetical protein
VSNRVVRFYDLRILRNDELHGQEVEPGFWRQLAEIVNDRAPEKREEVIRGRRIFGEHRVSVQPARPYFYIGRVRNRAEWPDTLLDDGSGVVGRLEPSQQGAVLLEPSYVVPFGDRNRVAIMSMSRTAPSMAALEEWITAQSEMHLRDLQISLIPILNSRVMERLSRARGATSLTVVVEPMRTIPDGGGQIGHAARAARQVSTETDLTLKWSLGNRKGKLDTTSGLLDAARWIDDSWAKSAEVSLDITDDAGDAHREHYNLIKHRFTIRAQFDAPDDQHCSESSVIGGITDAIDEFSRQMR